MDETLSRQILDAAQCTQPIRDKQAAKAFFRFLWHDLKLNFTADDDFSTFGLFTADAADLLNQRMNECFDRFHEQTYDLLIVVMEE